MEDSLKTGSSKENEQLELDQNRHPRLPQYTAEEVNRAIDAIRILIKVRDRCRQQGLIDW